MSDVDLDNLGPDDGAFSDGRGGFSGSSRGTRAGTKGFIGFMVVVAVAFLGVALYMTFRPTHKPGLEKPHESANSLPRYSFAPVQHPTPAVPANQPAPGGGQKAPVSADRLANSGYQGTATGSNQQHKETPEEAAMKRRLGHDFDIQAETTSDSSSHGAAQPHGHPSDLDNRLEGSELHAAKARRIPESAQNLMIARGTVIPCGTLEEIDTTHPGFIACNVSRDVWSMNGKVRLIDKGAHVDGEIGSGVTFGQKRVFVNWNRLRNPDGVVIELASPAIGPLGATGIAGSINNHFWDRFGDAMLVSVFADLGQTAIQSISNLASKAGTTSINTNNSSSSSSQLASQVLQQTLNIQPTLTAPQGDAVAIIAARDLDFSSVYNLSDGN